MAADGLSGLLDKAEGLVDKVVDKDGGIKTNVAVQIDYVKIGLMVFVPVFILIVVWFILKERQEG